MLGWICSEIGCYRCVGKFECVSERVDVGQCWAIYRIRWSLGYRVSCGLSLHPQCNNRRRNRINIISQMLTRYKLICLQLAVITSVQI